MRDQGQFNVEECKTCDVKVSCDKCTRQLCSIDSNYDKFANKPHKIEGYYLINGKAICPECYGKNNLL